MDSTRDLLVRGIAAAKANSESEARFFLEWVLRVYPSKVEKIEALYWLSTLATVPEQERELLNLILIEDPDEPRALRKLLVMDGKLKEQDIIDPETYRQVQEPAAPAASVGITCPKCGGRLTYAADGSSLICEYCTTRKFFRQNSGPRSDDDLSGNDFIASMATTNGHNQSLQQHLLTCRGCGAEFLISDNRISASCPFCQSSQIVDTSVIRQMIPPSRIIPLRIGHAGLNLKELKKICGDQFLQKHRETRPAFYPVWEFELNGLVTWRLPVSVLSDDMEEKTFDVPIQHRITQVMAVDGFLSRFENLEDGFDYSDVQPYSPEYLVDSLAAGYTLPVSDAALIARGKLVKMVTEESRQRLGWLMKGFLLDSSGMHITQFWLTLVPMYIFKDAKKKLTVLVNGQTGVVRSAKT